MNSNLIANKKTVQFLVILILGIALGLATMSVTKEPFSCSTSSHVVVEGDTLWGIAEDNCSGSIQKVSDDLVKVYGLPLEVGKIIYLPKSDDCKLFIKEDQGQEYVYEECE
jgi:hypothetical protein